ncbi:phosphate ABC transporter substrate-binding protein [Treponema sp. R6D11]
MKTKVIAVLMTLLALTSVFAQGNSRTASAYTIEVGGSTSVTPLMELLATEYSKSKPNIKVNINGTGSGDGINNTGVLYQIGMSSRELTPAEQGKGLKETIIAIDGIAVIVNKKNAVANLTIEQIRNIYTGAVTNWRQVGGKNAPIAVVSREEGSGTRGAFEELAGFQGKLLAKANQLTSTGAILANVAQNPDAIGYISLGSLNDSIKAVSVSGVAATSVNVVNGTYKIARPFIVLTGKNVHAESTAFIQWILGADGQKVVSKSWIPVN